MSSWLMPALDDVGDRYPAFADFADAFVESCMGADRLRAEAVWQTGLADHRTVIALLRDAHPEASPETLTRAASLLAAFVEDDTAPERVGRQSLLVAQRLRELFEGGARVDRLEPVIQPPAPATVDA